MGIFLQKGDGLGDASMEGLAVILAAHNEDKVIGKTLFTLIDLVGSANIYVVSDCSVDYTDTLLKYYGVRFVRNKKNLGKVMSLKRLIDKFQILNKYDYVSILDADSVPEPDFYSILLKSFKKDIACVCGSVLSEYQMNLFVAYRSVMYMIWQEIYKVVSSKFNGVAIAPGTSSVYRTSVLKKIDFDKNMIIEDFDMTFQVHRKNLGKIIYVKDAVVITQDPDNYHDYQRQLTRWMLGLFQSMRKHKIPTLKQNFEYFMLLLIINDLIHSIVILFVVPLALWAWILTDMAPGFVYNLRFRWLAIITVDIWFIWGFAILHDIRQRKLFASFFGPFLWQVQFVNVKSYLEALYQTFFKNIKGAWVSPKRR